MHLTDRSVLQRCRGDTPRDIPRQTLLLGATHLALTRPVRIEIILRCNLVILEMARHHKTVTGRLPQPSRTTPRHPLHPLHSPLSTPHLGATGQRDLPVGATHDSPRLSRIRFKIQRQQVKLFIIQRFDRIRKIRVPRILRISTHLSGTRKRPIIECLHHIKIGVLHQSPVIIQKSSNILIRDFQPGTPHDYSILRLTHIINSATLKVTRIPHVVTGISRVHIPPRIIRLFHLTQRMIRIKIRRHLIQHAFRQLLNATNRKVSDLRYQIGSQPQLGALTDNPRDRHIYSRTTSHPDSLSERRSVLSDHLLL